MKTLSKLLVITATSLGLVLGSTSLFAADTGQSNQVQSNTNEPVTNPNGTTTDKSLGNKTTFGKGNPKVTKTTTTNRATLLKVHHKKYIKHHPKYHRHYGCSTCSTCGRYYW